MEIPAWFAVPGWLQKAVRPQQDAAQPRDGAHPLDPGARQLVPPVARGPFCRLRPAFCAEALRLSLQLANMAYTLDVAPWADAGWDDFTIRIDDDVQSGITAQTGVSGERMRSAAAAYKLYRSRLALDEPNPVAQLMGALRQRERSDTVKAVCMMRPMADGTFVLAIGFMGTGKRFYDWFSNLRITAQDGFHKGFGQLCACFEEGLEDIVFPRTAQALGLQKLTLADVFAAMRSTQSPFRLWMAGHSQGAAVMQILAHRLMAQGVPAQNMVGYGFASPTVATRHLTYDPAAYPLYHVLNADDLVTRVGAEVHLGLCLQYAPDDAMRAQVYAPSRDPADAQVRNALAPLLANIVDTSALMVHTVALLECMVEEKGEEGLNDLMTRWWAGDVIDRLLVQAGDRAMGLVDRIRRSAGTGYASLTGRAMSREEVDGVKASLRPIVQSCTLRRLTGALGSLFSPPHRLTGAYAYIAQNAVDRLLPFVWDTRGDAPVRRFREGVALSRPVPPHTAPKRRRHAPPAAMRGKMRLSLTAQQLAKRSQKSTSCDIPAKADFVP